MTPRTRRRRHGAADGRQRRAAAAAAVPTPGPRARAGQRHIRVVRRGHAQRVYRVAGPPGDGQGRDAPGRGVAVVRGAGVYAEPGRPQDGSVRAVGLVGRAGRSRVPHVRHTTRRTQLRRLAGEGGRQRARRPRARLRPRPRGRLAAARRVSAGHRLRDAGGRGVRALGPDAQLVLRSNAAGTSVSLRCHGTVSCDRASERRSLRNHQWP